MSNNYYVYALGAVLVVWTAAAVMVAYGEHGRSTRYQACIKYHSPKDCK